MLVFISFIWHFYQNHPAEKNLIHRDLAARNILVGSDNRVKCQTLGWWDRPTRTSTPPRGNLQSSHSNGWLLNRFSTSLSRSRATHELKFPGLQWHDVTLFICWLFISLKCVWFSGSNNKVLHTCEMFETRIHLVVFLRHSSLNCSCKIIISVESRFFELGVKLLRSIDWGGGNEFRFELSRRFEKNEGSRQNNFSCNVFQFNVVISMPFFIGGLTVFFFGRWQP